MVTEEYHERSSGQSHIERLTLGSSFADLEPMELVEAVVALELAIVS